MKLEPPIPDNDRGGGWLKIAWSKQTDKLIRRYINGLCFVVVLSVFVLGVEAMFWQLNRATIFDLLIALLILLVLVRVFWQWVRWLKGKVVFKASRTLPLRDGEIDFPRPSSRYEVWLFCEVPFSRYCGSILISSGVADERYTVKLPRHLWRLSSAGSNFAPVVWRLPSGVPNGQSQCRVQFNLRPAFADTSLGGIFITHEAEFVTLVVKAI